MSRAWERGYLHHIPVDIRERSQSNSHGNLLVVLLMVGRVLGQPQLASFQENLTLKNSTEESQHVRMKNF